MKKILGALAAGVLAFGLGTPAYAAAPPPEFGTDWDDPTTAAPAVERPAGHSCTVQIVDHKFVNFTPFTGTYVPPGGCGAAGSWSKVVLDLHGAVKGRQFDRLGALSLGGVTIFKTSTPEPSADGIQWHVEKDVTQYSALLKSEQPIWMLIGNVVNETYTGILDVQVSLTFYTGAAAKVVGPDHVYGATPHTVQALDGLHREGPDQVGTVTVDRKTERLVAEVYATGSGGGCEEFWYTVAPADTAYSCAYASGPYREVQVLIDGKLAGIASPYPHIYTGGWSNPFLWYAVPAPRAFSIRPLSYDLSPFLGQLTDGAAHRVSVRVVGVPEGQVGWDVPTNILGWQGAGVVTGTAVETADYPASNVVTAGGMRVAVKAGHRFTASATLRTASGQVQVSVDQTVGNDSVHTWSEGENHDELNATWTDASVVSRLGAGPGTGIVKDTKRFTVNGYIDVNSANRLVTKLTLGDYQNWSRIGGGPIERFKLEDVFDGEAGFTLGVPRPERHATGTSQETYKLNGVTRIVKTVNGYRV
ncbi:peptide-N4-asparagine amidase [Longispora albida]|uniref:peptide-N4-asparagine amidase n=1 Tax=Longispora albida TaxID=203523 RepID=UPI000381E8DA|nr:peptide-N4-asparagine amidase [Longispora albida]